MPVGTRGAVKHLAADDLRELGVQVVLANTYHLMLRPGADTVAALGGLHRFMSFDGHVLTDSGGFQVFSLSPQVDDDGVTFRSVYDGSVHRLTPERAVEVQEALGADIQMALDVCPPLPSPPEVVRLAVERTASWAAARRWRIGARDKRSSGSCKGASTSTFAGRAPAGRSRSGLLATASEGCRSVRRAKRCFPRSRRPPTSCPPIDFAT